MTTTALDAGVYWLTCQLDIYYKFMILMKATACFNLLVNDTRYVCVIVRSSVTNCIQVSLVATS